MTDFNTLVNSDNIEDKLKTLQGEKLVAVEKG